MMRYFRFYVNQLTGLRTREWPLFFRLFNHILLMLCLIILLRSVNNGLLLSTYSPAVYPWFFMAEALLSFSLSLVYARWASPTWSMARQQAIVLIIFALVIGIGRCAMYGNITWINFALPVLCDAISAILLLQSWGLFSNLVDGRQAKRFFPLLGLGGTTGSIIGGWLSAQTTHWIGTENILFLALALLGGIGATLWRIHTFPNTSSTPLGALDLPELNQTGKTFQRRLKDTLTPLFKHPLLLYVLGILLTVRITSTLMDYQMQLQVKALADQDAMTAYMGRFFAFTSMFTLGVQLFFESRFIQRYGLVWGLASTPLSLVGGTLMYIVHPSLFTISALKFSELLTRYSTFKTATELAYIPFEPRLRSNLRILTNGLLSVGTVPMISLAILFFADQRYVLIGLSLGFACLGVYLSLLIAKPYREKLQGSLDQKRLGHLYKAPSHSFNPESLQYFLKKSRPIKVVFFLEHVLHERIELPVFPWQALLKSEDSRIRELSWRQLYRYPDTALLQFLPDLLAHEQDPRVQEAAIKALRRIGSDELNDFILGLLQHAALRVQVECLVYLFECGGIEGILKGAEYLKQWINHPASRQRSAAAYAMGEIGIRFFRQDYLTLFHDPETNVRKACLRAARKAIPDTLLPLLIRQLADPELGALSVDTLSSLASDQLIPACRVQLPFLRKHPTGLPHLIALISRYTALNALDLLMELFLEPQFTVKYAVIQQLSQLRYENALDTSAYHTQLKSQLSQEIYFGFLYLQILYQLQGVMVHQQRHRFLYREIERRYHERIDMLFLILGLLYPSYEMEQARQNYTSNHSHFRALSLEVLNYTLESEWVQPITTLLDDISPAQKIRRAQEHHWSDSILDISWYNHPLILQDPWLSRLSQWCLTYPKESPMFPIIERMFVLQQSALFAQFGAEVLSTIAEVCHNTRYRDGESIFKAQDEASAFYFIAKGRVNLYIHDRLLHQLNTFEGFGEIELLSESKRLATAVANGPCELLCLQQKDFLDLMESQASFAQSLLKSLAQRLSIQMEHTSSSTSN